MDKMKYELDYRGNSKVESVSGQCHGCYDYSGSLLEHRCVRSVVVVLGRSNLARQ